MRRAAEPAGATIPLNVVSPGVVDTPMIAAARQGDGGETFVDAAPIGRISTAAEQASAMVFLAGDGDSYVTGAELLTDGGLVAGVTTGDIASPFPAPPDSS